MSYEMRQQTRLGAFYDFFNGVFHKWNVKLHCVADRTIRSMRSDLMIWTGAS